jgi:outer membrane protein assembly factor BamB
MARVFAADSEGDVVRVESGRTVWKTRLKTTVSGGVGASADLVVVGTPKGEVIALDAASGEIKWRVAISAEVLAPPAVSDGIIVVRAADSRLFGLDPARRQAPLDVSAGYAVSVAAQRCGRGA